MIEWAARQGDEVIIETRGKPSAVLAGHPATLFPVGAHLAYSLAPPQ